MESKHPAFHPLWIALFFYITLLSLSSCKSSKEISGSRSKKNPADSLLVTLGNSRIQYEWFSAKARVSYEDNSTSKSFTAAIRMRKDSVIWISVTSMLGVEVARLLIHNDSVFLLDRLNKIYRHEPLSLLEQYFSFPLKIDLLQKMLVGNALFIAPEQAKIKQEKNKYTVASENEQYKYTLSFDSDNLAISTEHLTDIQSGRSILLVFDEYKSEEERLFSYARTISVKADEPIELSLKFSKVKWDEPLTFPFQVSEKYE
ncbi:MAG: lipoprotein insertase outer membrane protein LolB [Chitinophagales bacterium]|nr:lipoprotein insertase outer membrane protein LolB [Chitinophagales bacterium]